MDMTFEEMKCRRGKRECTAAGSCHELENSLLSPRRQVESFHFPHAEPHVVLLSGYQNVWPSCTWLKTEPQISKNSPSKPQLHCRKKLLSFSDPHNNLMSVYNTLYIYISNIKIKLASVIYTIKLSLYQIFTFFLSVATLVCCFLS